MTKSQKRISRVASAYDKAKKIKSSEELKKLFDEMAKIYQGK